LPLIEVGIVNQPYQLVVLPPNNANQRELESKVFIEFGRACESIKATK